MLDSEPLVSTHETATDTSTSRERRDPVRDRVDSPQQYQDWREYAFSEFPEGEDRQV